MKQINKTPEITARLQKAVGDGVSTDDLVVYECIALNTLPLRKESALYKNAVTERGILVQMAEQVSAESLPVQLVHDSRPLPVGRLFSAEVVNSQSGAELRGLFYISKTETDIIRKIDNGVVDQVSVSILPKQILCSDCGFDFLGPNAQFENLYDGVCDKGHKLGEGHTHAKLVGLDKFYELSLVGRGGAQNARIVNRDKSVFSPKLAANGVETTNKLNLTSAQGISLMDIETLIAQLTDAKAKLVAIEGEVASLKASIGQKDAKISELTAQLSEAPDQAVLADVKSNLNTAVLQLKEIATRVLVASGDVSAIAPDGVAELTEIIKTKGAKMAALLTAGGSAPASLPKSKSVDNTLSAYRTA